MYKLLIILLVLPVFDASAVVSKMQKFREQLNEKCQGEEVSSLMSKKVMLEMITKSSCKGALTKKLMASCQMECSEVNAVLRAVEQTRSGAVVGD